MRQWINLVESTEHVWERVVQEVRNKYAPNFMGSCEGASAELAEKLTQMGIPCRVMQGMFDHPYDHDGEQCERSGHVWVEIDGYILDPTVEQFDTDQTVVPLTSEEALRYEGYEQLGD